MRKLLKSTLFGNILTSLVISNLHFMWSICKKDIGQFFSSLIGYIAIILFLLINGFFLFVFKDTSLFEYGYASLDSFFELAPWVLMFLVPAVAMRSLADEFRSGTFETITTKPLTPLQITAGKYLAILVVVFIAIVPTFIYLFTLQTLSTGGGIDIGATMGSYVGLFLLAASFAAIGIVAGSITHNSVVAFLASAFFCLLLYYGFNAISKIPVFEGSADYYIEMFGIDYHYRSISRGVVDTRDVVYFVSIILLGLAVTAKNLNRR